MDYDATDIASVYDRARALMPETARLWCDLLMEYVDVAAGAPIIDLGCGTGRFSQLLAREFGLPVIGIDPSEKMLEQARGKPASANLSYRQGVAEALPLPGRFKSELQ
jgi:ubiquinone/menaquinone biosynthesis C-methylase UbiE